MVRTLAKFFAILWAWVSNLVTQAWPIVSADVGPTYGLTKSTPGVDSWDETSFEQQSVEQESINVSEAQHVELNHTEAFSTKPLQFTDEANVLASPVCALLQAAQSADTSTSASLVHTGQSSSGPTRVVDGILAVAALRRGRQRYQSLFACAPLRTALHVKVPHLHVEDLDPGFIGTLTEALRNQDCAVQVVGASVRRGCIQLSLDMLHVHAGRGPADPAAAATPHKSDDSVTALHRVLPDMVMSALGVPPPSEGSGSGQHDVIVQRGDQCWKLIWDTDTSRWQVLSIDDDMDSSDGVLNLRTALAWHTPMQLASGASTSAGLLIMDISVCCAPDFDAFGPKGFLIEREATQTDSSGLPSARIPYSQPLTLIAKANGRTTVGVVTAVLDVSSNGNDANDQKCTRDTQSHTLQVQLDLGYLAAGRPSASLGQVVRLEVWRGVRMLASTSFTCLRDDNVVAELLAMQRDAAAAGQLDSEDEGYMSDEQQRGEAEALLGDLGAWLDYVAARNSPPQEHAGVRVSNKSSMPQDPAGEDLDMSSQVGSLLRDPQAQALLQGTGLHLLEYAVYNGFLALARGVHKDLKALHGDVLRAREGVGEVLTLLHRAVRSGNQEVVEQVLEWFGGSRTVDGEEGLPAASTVWSVRGPGGVTPLHLLAVDARCGGWGAGQGPAEAVEALLRWVLSTFPAAVNVWNTARDSSGNTPAMLWTALGGQDLQPQAAAAALARAASTTAPNAADASANGGASSAGTSTAPEERLLACSSPPLTYGQLLWISLTGFPSPSMERQYLAYVTVNTSPSTLIWLVLMAVAHATAFYKSPTTGEARQTFVGGAAYVVSLVLMAAAPRLYNSWREPLMLCCLLGRSVCRLLMVMLPDMFHMAEAVRKYVVFGLDILLDGFLEGTFEQFRMPFAIMARLIEWPIIAALILSHGMYATYSGALLRSSAVSAAGLLMASVSDVRMRAAFLRERRVRPTASDHKKEL